MKTIVCRCEDVTLSDIRRSFELGYTDIEEVKRYTGFGTGPCQGKECLVLVAELLAKETEGELKRPLRPFTARPPIEPVPLGIFARADEDHK
jgi:bacterioferritin-associated ferredoxin